jgi:hypothetical protein
MQEYSDLSNVNFRAGETIIITASSAITTTATSAAALLTAGPVPSSYH